MIKVIPLEIMTDKYNQYFIITEDVKKIVSNIYNFNDLYQMGLYPCAYSMTFNVTKNKSNNNFVLNAILNQRSSDVLVANNWNVCQYALLMMMLARECDMELGELVHVIADCHIYDRHVPIVNDMLSRKEFPAPKVYLNPNKKSFYDFSVDDLIIESYETNEQIKNIPVAI